MKLSAPADHSKPRECSSRPDVEDVLLSSVVFPRALLVFPLLSSGITKMTKIFPSFLCHNGIHCYETVCVMLSYVVSFAIENIHSLWHHIGFPSPSNKEKGKFALSKKDTARLSPLPRTLSARISIGHTTTQEQRKSPGPSQQADTGGQQPAKSGQQVAGGCRPRAGCGCWWLHANAISLPRL
jgi:hypothetical protein